MNNLRERLVPPEAWPNGPHKPRKLHTQPIPAPECRQSACYGYNSYGFAKSVEVSFSGDCASIDKTVISNINYNEFGDVVQVDRGNGVSTTFTYDTRGRATNLLTQATVNGQLVKHQDERIRLTEPLPSNSQNLLAIKNQREGLTSNLQKEN